MQPPRRDKPLPLWLNILITLPILVGILAIATLGFAGSFTGMREVVRPYFHNNSWIVPIAVDASIIVLTAFDLRAIRAQAEVPWLRYVVLGLNAATVFLNSEASDKLVGKIVHAIMPMLYIVIVEAIRAGLSKWVAQTSEDRVESIPWNMWLTPLSTFPMWYRRNRWRIHTIDELVAREQARELAVLRLKARAGKLSRGWWPKWKKGATADELWAIKTYAFDPGGVVRKTAAAITRDTLSAHTPVHAPAHTHTAHTPEVTAPALHEGPASPEPVRAEGVHVPAPRTPVPAPLHAESVPVHAAEPAGRPPEVKPTQWANVWANPEAVLAWKVYAEMRTEADGRRPAVQDVHTQSGCTKDRSTVSRWCKLFDARWGAERTHAHANGIAHVNGSSGPADPEPAEV